MAFFKKKDKVIDLTEKYFKEQERVNNIKESAQEAQQQSSGFDFFSGMASAGQSNSEPTTNEYMDMSEDYSDKKRKLAKRLVDMTEKLEDISNQIYHLQQRVELLEKKSGVNRY